MVLIKYIVQGGLFEMRNFKRISLILVLAMLISVVAPFAAIAKESSKIIIVHTNDSHARVFEDQYEGMGFAKIAAKVNLLKEENPNTILADAGDTLHGLPIATISEGESIVKLLNAMGYDVMVPGNHDFNYGVERLVELSEMMDFPLITANIQKDGRPLFEPYIIKEVDGIKLAFFGLSTPETAYKTNPLNVADLDFVDPVDVANDMVKALEGKADFVIALTHLGVDEDSKDTSIKVAENVKGIDLIIDGHSHTTFPEGKKVGDTLIVQTGEHTKNLGIVEIEFEDKKAISTKVSLFTKKEAAEVNEDEKIKGLIDSIEEENKEITSVIVGESAVRLDGEREHVRCRESNLGNLIADATLKASGADMAIVNGGNIRTSIEPGDITAGDIIEVLPFGNYVVVIEISGKDVITALEHGTSSYPETKGGFPQVAGITYTIDTTKPAGQRVTNVKVAGNPIDPDKMYTLAINDFLAVGGDEYTMFPKCKTVVEMSSLNEIVIDYIKELGTIDIQEEGRITIIKAKEDTAPEPEETPTSEAEPEPKSEPETKPEPKSEPKPVPVEKPAAAVAEEKTYIVNPGDVLWKIAEKFGMTWEKLAEYNRLKNPHLIFPGQKILIPVN